MVMIDQWLFDLLLLTGYVGVAVGVAMVLRGIQVLMCGGRPEDFER